MNYNPMWVESTEFISKKDLETLHALSEKYKLSKLLNSPRNIDELGLDFIYSSAQIEGNTYDKFETKELIQLGITTAGKKYSDATMILNMRKAYETILNPINVETVDFIKDLHFELSNLLVNENERGTVRRESVLIGGSEYKPLDNPGQLNEELKYLVKQMGEIKDPFVKAIYAHLNICYLQYFMDCNKRTARFYQNAILVSQGITPLLFRDKVVDGYVQSVITYYETGKHEEYIKWFIKAYEDFINRFNSDGPILPSRIF